MIFADGAVIFAIGLSTCALLRLTSPLIFSPSAVKSTFELSIVTVVLEGTFFTLTLSILRLTFGTILSSLPFKDVFIDKVPLLILFSFNKDICPRASNNPLN